MNAKTMTKGNVDVAKIKVGDVHYEYDLGQEIESTVITEPVRSGDGQWSWEAKTNDGKFIRYMMTEGLAHYGPNLYDYRAYARHDPS